MWIGVRTAPIIASDGSTVSVIGCVGAVVNCGHLHRRLNRDVIIGWAEVDGRSARRRTRKRDPC
eukprot:2398951-Pyramimonas_sp.AAC.1